MLRMDRIVLKSRREIGLMCEAGRVVRLVLRELAGLVRPGVTTAELDARADDLIREAGGVPLFRGVRNPQARVPFPGCLCVSVNDEVVHGIPKGRVLSEGDIVSVDCGVRLKGYCGDAAMTYPVGQVAPETRRLLEVTAGTLELAKELVRPGVKWSQVARAMQRYVESRGYGVVRDFVGHGVGQQMHEEPKVPNYWDRNQKNADFELVPGMTIAVEPMVTLGRPEVVLADRVGWTVVTKDGKPAAHFEDTLAVTESGVEVLTDGN